MARGRKYVEVIETGDATVVRRAKVSVPEVLTGDLLDRVAAEMAREKFGAWHIEGEVTVVGASVVEGEL